MQVGGCEERRTHLGTRLDPDTRAPTTPQKERSRVLRSHKAQRNSELEAIRDWAE